MQNRVCKKQEGLGGEVLKKEAKNSHTDNGRQEGF